MSDIVRQARAVTHPACKLLVNELADEIERLTTERANRYWEGRYRDEKADNERLRAIVTRLMAQPTNHPLEMTPDERKELWAAHEEARRALENKP